MSECVHPSPDQVGYVRGRLQRADRSLDGHEARLVISFCPDCGTFVATASVAPPTGAPGMATPPIVLLRTVPRPEVSDG